MKQRTANADYIESLKRAILRLHGCDATHLESVPVLETFRGKTVWSGVVEVFTLTDHPKAKRCYAWSHAQGKGDQGRRFVVILERPPVKSAQDAVRVDIVGEVKGKS